jgi:hypothetical protein
MMARVALTNDQQTQVLVRLTWVLTVLTSLVAVLSLIIAWPLIIAWLNWMLG